MCDLQKKLNAKKFKMQTNETYTNLSECEVAQEPQFHEQVDLPDNNKAVSGSQRKLRSLWGLTCVTLVVALLALIVSLAVAVISVETALKVKSGLMQELQKLQHQLTPPSLAPAHPPHSCKDIPQNSLSGNYWIQASNSSPPVQVYCDTARINCACKTTGTWTRVANLNMTNSNQSCPDGFRLVNRTEPPLRTCGRPGNGSTGCVSVTFPTHGIEYSHVCGRVIGYQDSSPNAFWSKATVDINSSYVDGISITHGELPKKHIWTFAAALDESAVSGSTSQCPCTRQRVTMSVVPPFIGRDYFCDTASRDRFQYKFYPDDPLWDGQGCGCISTCCEFNNPPWFCKQLPQSTTDDIELRLCGDNSISNEDTPIERVEIYVN